MNKLVCAFCVMIIVLLYLLYRYNRDVIKICVAIPTTSNGRDWKIIEESYIYKSLNNFNMFTDKYDISIYISYDYDDKLYSKQKEKDKLNNKYPKLNIKWFSNEFEKGHVVAHWNYLYDKAVKDNYKYTLLIGDDINYPDNDIWLTDFVDSLKQNNDIGISGGYSGHPFMTQFLVSDIHHKMLGYAFNPKIKNWYCDNYLFELYPDKYINFFKNHVLNNAGGNPRYKIDNISSEYKEYVKEDKLKVII